jgi:hypothetical protein
MNPEPKELKDALSRTHADEENTGELIRLEEVLNDAASSAKKAISLRRRLSVERTKRGQGGGTASDRAPTDRAAGGESEKIREIVDGSGRPWRVWEVPPEQLDRTRPGAYAGDFEKGWLCFESGNGQERRRLPSYPANWRSLPVPKLLALLDEAKPVPPRRKRGTGAEAEGGDA